MIKAEELRIGNLFLAGKTIHPERVFKIDFEMRDGHLINGQIPEEHCHGIELTEEWLLKFGLEYVDEAAGYVLGHHLIPETAYKDYEVHLFCEENCAVKIKHVHQLQNLFYALTGEELTLKQK